MESLKWIFSVLWAFRIVPIFWAPRNASSTGLHYVSVDQHSIRNQWPPPTSRGSMRCASATRCSVHPWEDRHLPMPGVPGRPDQWPRLVDSDRLHWPVQGSLRVCWDCRHEYAVSCMPLNPFSVVPWGRISHFSSMRFLRNLPRSSWTVYLPFWLPVKLVDSQALH